MATVPSNFCRQTFANDAEHFSLPDRGVDSSPLSNMLTSPTKHAASNGDTERLETYAASGPPSATNSAEREARVLSARRGLETAASQVET
jgi:hypothetical protein